MDVIAETPGEEEYLNKETKIHYEIVSSDGTHVGKALTLDGALIAKSSKVVKNLIIKKVTVIKETI
jgi:hypothetical protein